MNAQIVWEEYVKVEMRRQLYRTLSYIVGEEMHRAALRIMEERCGGCRVAEYFQACLFDDDDVYEEALRDLDVEYVREIFFETVNIRRLDPNLIDFDKTLAEVREKWGDRQFRDGKSRADGPAFMRSMNVGLYSKEFYSEADATNLARGRVDRRLDEEMI